MFCPKCGKDAGNAKFCPECGTAISGSEPSIQSPPSSIGLSGRVVRRKPVTKKNHGALIAVLVFLAMIVLLSALGNSLFSENKGEIKQVFDPTRFLVESEGAIRPMTEAELIGELGQPESIEEWNFQYFETEAPVRTLSYHNGKYLYNFNNDQLVRIEIYVPVSFVNKENIPQMYNLSEGTVSADTPAVYRVNDCGVYELQVLYNTDGSKIDTAFISYTSFFDDLGNAMTTSDQKQRPNLELLSSESTSDGYSRYVTGQIRNNTDKTYSYAQVEINLYSNGVQVGSTLDNINNLEPHSIWEFKAIILQDNADQFKVKDISGW